VLQLPAFESVPMSVLTSKVTKCEHEENQGRGSAKSHFEQCVLLTG